MITTKGYYEAQALYEKAKKDFIDNPNKRTAAEHEKARQLLNRIRIRTY